MTRVTSARRKWICCSVTRRKQRRFSIGNRRCDSMNWSESWSMRTSSYSSGPQYKNIWVKCPNDGVRNTKACCLSRKDEDLDFYGNLFRSCRHRRRFLCSTSNRPVNVMMNTQNCFPKLVRQICVPLTLGCFAGSLAWLPAARAQSEQQFYDSVTVPTTN